MFGSVFPIINMSLFTWISHGIEAIGNVVYEYFISYLLVKEVGETAALFYNTCFWFLFCIVLVYAAKPWGLTKWNRNVTKNRRRLRELAFKNLRQEFALNGDDNDEEMEMKRRRISELTFTELRDELQNETISASDAVDAFRRKALECQEKYNCIVEFIKEAPSWAEVLDETYKGRKKPPLFGMPFSVKENICLIGYDCSRGLAKELEWPMKEESSLITHLRQIGAVPIVRTNIPQTLVSFMCSNPTYGTTLNPFDKTRTPGGSSGGEACLIAAGGCPFGVGSDVAGSLRIPAHFCGVTALKPTSNRLKATGTRSALPGIRLKSTFGFFTKDVASQTFLLRCSLVPEYFLRVPQCVPLPFVSNDDDSVSAAADREKSGGGGLRIGYYVEDGWFPSVAACRRAVLKAKRILESAGHELVPFSVPEPNRAMRLLLKSIFPDNGEYWLGNLKYEDLDPNLKITKRLMSLPLWIRWLGARLTRVLVNDDEKTSTAIGAYTRGLSDARATNEDADAYINEFFQHWTSERLDAVVGTVLPFPAVHHHLPTKLGQAVFGTGVYNLLDAPAGVVAVDHVTEEDERDMTTTNYPPAAASKTRFQNPTYRLVRESMVGAEGLPLCVQVIAPPYREELCLRIMKIIESGR